MLALVNDTFKQQRIKKTTVSILALIELKAEAIMTELLITLFAIIPAIFVHAIGRSFPAY